MLAQTLAVVAVAILYAAFDVFNNRNVPDLFAYASVAFGFVITLVYNSASLQLSLELALVIWFAGYALYRSGIWGAGDYYELVAISLMLPIQPTPVYNSVLQFGLPFVLSVLISSGFAAILVLPVYYLLFVKRKWSKMPDAKHIAYGAILFLLYMAMLIAVSYLLQFNAWRALFVLLVAAPSALIVVFEEEITARMVEHVLPKQLGDGDIIATGAMAPAERKFFLKYKGFGRLATRQLISQMQNEKRKLPVYKNAAPLAAFIFIGVAVSLLFGNIILLLL
jgi:hypothetical protein